MSVKGVPRPGRVIHSPAGGTEVVAGDAVSDVFVMGWQRAHGHNLSREPRPARTRRFVAEPRYVPASARLLENPGPVGQAGVIGMASRLAALAKPVPRSTMVRGHRRRSLGGGRLQGAAPALAPVDRFGQHRLPAGGRERDGDERTPA